MWESWHAFIAIDLRHKKMQNGGSVSMQDVNNDDYSDYKDDKNDYVVLFRIITMH